MLRKIFGLTRLFAATVLLFCHAAFALVKVVESTPSRLVLDWELSGFDTVTVSGNFTAISYNGGTVPSGALGAAFIPAYPIHVGAPTSGAVRVSVEPIEFASIRLRHPLSKRTATPDSAAPVFTSRWVSDPRYGMMRGYRAAHVLLRPVYDMGGMRVQLLKRARIVFEFPSAPHTGETWRPRGEFERVTERMLANFSVAQGWQGRGARGLRKKVQNQQNPYPLAYDKPLAFFKVGDGNQSLNEGLTSENSLIKIRGSAIRKIFGAGVPIASVALYASASGAMDVLVPQADEIPPGVHEVPILRYDRNGNGVTDDEDYIVAYVSGASDFGRVPDFIINPYDDSRTYWLAVKDGRGLEMEHFASLPPANEPLRDVFESHVYHRTPQVQAQRYANHTNEGGIEWVWKRFTPSRADTTIRLHLPGADAGRGGSLAFKVGHSDSGAISADLGAARLCSSCGGSLVNVENFSSRDLVIKYTAAARGSRYQYYELDAIHARYWRPIVLSDTSGKFEIFSTDASADAVNFRLTKNSGGLAYIVRVPTGSRYISLIDTVRAQTHVWNADVDNGVRYLVTLEKDIVDYSDSLTAVDGRVVLDAAYQIRELRNAPAASSIATDFLIITHEEFLDAALALAKHKVGMGFVSPRVVLLGDILNQFSGGNMDPVAIRNFLYYVYGNWGGGDVLSYVTLMGVGHNDYKNVASRVVNFMPVPYINNSFSDDFYVFFDVTAHPNAQHYMYYFLGRMPARSAVEARDMVEKIIETEDPRVAEFDSWRGRVLLSADDDQAGAAVDAILDQHILSSEKTFSIVRDMRPDIDVRKLYLFEYPWNAGYLKPAATRALINEMNSGVAVVNWFGHGSFSQIADERLMTREDIASLYNKKRYPLFTLFSCSVGKFDRPGDDCLASMLVRQPGAGAIAVVSSAREVYPDRNENLALPFFAALLGTTGGANLTFGSALTLAKADYRDSYNRYYTLLGDPSISLFDRNRDVALTLTDAAGVPLDTLKALQRVVVKGTVVGPSGEKDVSFGQGLPAYATLTLFNPPQDSARRKDGGRFSNPVYSMPGSPVFSAKINVVNGEFEQQLLLPMNLTFGKPGVKLAAYVWKEGEALIGSSHLGGLVFEGSESENFGDTLGPKISIRPIYNVEAIDRAGLFVKNRVTSELPLTLEVSIEDESGINVIGSGPDEGLTMEIRGALSKRSVNHLFQFSEGSFGQGTAMLTFEEGSLKSGAHELIISAQDLLGNVSRLSATLDVVDPAELKLGQVINVPNPVKMGRETRFYYYHSNVQGGLDVNVTIRVYSLGGRLLSVIRNPRNGEAWVPRDGHGNLLSPNVYLYQVTASSSNIGKSVKSKIKKLVVHPPR